jgi:hypothetical protein
MIDVELAAFLEEGIAIQLGTRNDRLEPNGVRVVSVTVDGDGRHLVAYVPDAAVAQVLPDLESNGQAALVFARPPDERACQVKGTFTSARPASEASAPASRRSGIAGSIGWRRSASRGRRWSRGSRGRARRSACG